MNRRFNRVEALFYDNLPCLLGRSLRAAAPVLLIVSFVLVGRTPAGVINGDFQTGDLTGWDANSLNPPLSTPATVDVITVGSSLVGDVQFSTSVGGHYAGSLSQDFYTGGATQLTFDIGFSASAPVTSGEPNVVDTLDVLVQNLDTNTTIVHTLNAQNQPDEPTGSGLVGHTNGLPIHALAVLSGSNSHVRLALLMNFHTLDGVQSSGQLLVDNVRLLPEPSTGGVSNRRCLGAGERGLAAAQKVVSRHPQRQLPVRQQATLLGRSIAPA